MWLEAGSNGSISLTTIVLNHLGYKRNLIINDVKDIDIPVFKVSEERKNSIKGIGRL